MRRRRATVLLALGRGAEARADADEARRLEPDDEGTKALEAELAAVGA